MKNYIEKLNSIPMLWVSGLFLAASFIAEYLAPWLGYSLDFPVNPAWVSLIISGIPMVYLAVTNTLSGRITSPLLITIAMMAAVYIGDIFAAGEIAFIMAIGEYLEDRTVEKAKKGIELLLDLVPTTGRKLSYVDGVVSETEVEASEINTGDILRILPGESFPADGTIIDGSTTVDQSIMTGESLPIDKTVGNDVFTGTINRFGSVDIEVTRGFSQSSLQKMIALVEEAEEHKAPTQKIVDKWAGYLVPTACAIAIVTYLILSFVLNRPDDALVRAVTVLVVFCPCALALATPTSIMAAIGQATRRGVLIKSGDALEQMGQVRTVAFDKTGTITRGVLAVSDVVVFSGDESEFISKVVAVEKRSEHPLGKAILRYGKDLEARDCSGFQLILGRGVTAVVGDGKLYCGNEALLKDAGIAMTAGAEELVSKLRTEGKAVIIVADSSAILGVIGLSDQIKDTAAAAISELSKAGIEQTILLTGDNKQSADFMAKQVGISQIFASLLPEDKVSAVQKLMETSAVCMVGDGVNDAPALKTANVGIAMGTMGSDIAIDAADIAIMGDDISQIAYLKRLSDATIFSIKFNITLSMIINCIAIVLSVTGLLTPATGALVHNAGSVLVVLNAARLYDKKI